MGRQSKFEHHKDAILRSIDTLTRREGKAPSMRQVALDTGTSVATLHAYLKKLRAQGQIEWIEGKHRSLRLSSGALAAVGQGQSPPSPPVTTATSSSPAPAAISAPLAPPPPPVRQVDESIDVGF